MIPQEIPSHEVEHGYAVDDYAWGEGFFMQGKVEDEVFWGWPSKADEQAFWAERKRVGKARARLGGFGFGAHVAT